RPRHPPGLRRPQRHAGVHPELHQRSQAGPRQVPAGHPGLLGLPGLDTTAEARQHPRMATASAVGPPRRRRRFSLLTRQDKIVLAVLVGVPAFIHIALVWVPTVASVVLSFTKWNGIGGLDKIQFVGLDNYRI